PQAPARITFRARAEDPASSLLREPHPAPDRREDGDLPDARLAHPGVDSGEAARPDGSLSGSGVTPLEIAEVVAAHHLLGDVDHMGITVVDADGHPALVDGLVGLPPCRRVVLGHRHPAGRPPDSRPEDGAEQDGPAYAQFGDDDPEDRAEGPTDHSADGP